MKAAGGARDADASRTTNDGSTRNRRDGGEIRYVIASSALGELLVARSADGVCAVLIGDDHAALIADLQARFPRATLRAEADTHPLAREVRSAVDSGAAECGAPLDLRGTAFQRTVWAALRQVPHGETVSYAELARRIGRPDAVRAVGQAIAANPIAVLVPCHRAIRSDGSLSGYRWGVQRKRALLERERGARTSPVPPS